MIESLDRLSREKLSEALTQFMMILNYGIEIVTLNDKQVYTKEIINSQPGAIFISLGSMFRANEESETKSKRISAAWKNKRAHASKIILTKKCPAWIQFNENTQKFELIKANAHIVKKIFHMCIHSCGLHGIAKYLNENNVPVFGVGKLWYRSYIAKIVNSVSVYGDYQSYTLIDGVREKAGGPVKSYYPSVIDENTFLLAKAAIQRRTSNDRGRKGLNFSNIFSGLIYCGYCNFKMILRNRGEPPKGGKYLCCSNENLGGGCSMKEWKLPELESSLFKHFKEIDFHEVLFGHDVNNLDFVKQLEIIDSNLQRLNNIKERIFNLLTSEEVLENTRSQFIQEMNRVVSEIESVEIERNNLKQLQIEEENVKEALTSDELKILIEKLDLNQTNYNFRSSLNQLLSRQIEKINLFHEQDSFTPWDYTEESPEVIDYKRVHDINKGLESFIDTKDFEIFCINYHKKISITYKTGSSRMVLVGSDYSITKAPRNNRDKFIEHEK